MQSTFTSLFVALAQNEPFWLMMSHTIISLRFRKKKMAVACLEDKGTVFYQFAACSSTLKHRHAGFIIRSVARFRERTRNAVGFHRKAAPQSRRGWNRSGRRARPFVRVLIMPERGQGEETAVLRLLNVRSSVKNLAVLRIVSQLLKRRNEEKTAVLVEEKIPPTCCVYSSSARWTLHELVGQCVMKLSLSISFDVHRYLQCCASRST